MDKNNTEKQSQKNSNNRAEFANEMDFNSANKNSNQNANQNSGKNSSKNSNQNCNNN